MRELPLRLSLLAVLAQFGLIVWAGQAAAQQPGAATQGRTIVCAFINGQRQTAFAEEAQRSGALILFVGECPRHASPN